MNTENVKTNDAAHCHVCPVSAVRTFDNFLRPFVHNTGKLFGKYVKPGMNVIDIGCGAGWASLGLARLVGDKGTVVAADLQPEMLEILKKRALKKNVSGIIRTHRCKSDSVGTTEKFDFALAFWMAHETPNVDGFIYEVYSILKNGGHFFIAEPKMHVSRDEVLRVIKIAENAGFKLVDEPKVRLSRGIVLKK